MMAIRWVVLMAVLSWTAPVHAACTGASPTWTCSNQTDLSTLLQGGSALQNNDTINVAAGTYVFNTQLNAVPGKNFNLVGAGIDVTIFQQGPSLTGSAALDITTAVGTGVTSISQLTIDGNGVSNGNAGNLILRGDSGKFRLHHVKFIVNGTSPLWITGYIRGVIDHNTWTWPVGVSGGIGVYTMHDAWLDTGAYGDQSWASQLSLGTDQNLFFEDNTYALDTWQPGDLFTYRFAQDGWKGFRRVDRFNHYRNTVWDMHGTAESTGRSHGALEWEIYSNDFVYNILNGGYANPADIRGGTGMVFDNTVTLTNGSTINSFANVKHEGASIGGLQPYPPFGLCGRLDDFYTLGGITSSGTTATININTTGQSPWAPGFSGLVWITVSGATQANYNGTFQVTVVDGTHMTYTMPGTATSPATGTIHITSPWNQNTNQYGDLCIGQVGAGPGDYLGGGTDPLPVGWPHQILAPAYSWNNLVGGVLNPMTSQNPNHLVENHHWYTQRSTFDGTVGVGRGLRASRPATCTIGVTYWSTDGGTSWNTTNGPGVDGGLDKCTATNTWTNDWYIPYPYPHYLVTSGGGTPPLAPALNMMRAELGELAMIDE